MRKIMIVGAAIISILLASGTAYAVLNGAGENLHREVFEFYPGHTHGPEGTVDAPEHSGGTDANGCHNASRPYHCH